MSQWTYVLSQRNGTVLGEIRQATERTVNLAMNKPSTAAFTVRPDNKWVKTLFSEDTILKVYERKAGSATSVLRFRGPIINTELQNDESGEPGSMTIKCSAVDAAFRMAHQWVSMTFGGPLVAQTFGPKDKGKIAKEMIDLTNTRIGSIEKATGVETGSLPYESGSEGTYRLVEFRYLLAVINDLANGTDGFDWRIEPYDTETGTIGKWHAEPVFGTTRTITFDYGWGKKNVRQISYLRDLTTLANTVTSLPEGGVESEGGWSVATESSASRTAHGEYDVIADTSGIFDFIMRDEFTFDVVTVRKAPRKIVGMTLDFDDGSKRIPQIGPEGEGDFWLGDFVQSRAVLPAAALTLFNGLIRIYQINVAINDAGRGTITPILIDEKEEI